jgi:replicative DNA helicase
MNNAQVHLIARFLRSGRRDYLATFGLSAAQFGPYQRVLDDILDYAERYQALPPWSYVAERHEDLLPKEPDFGAHDDAYLVNQVRGAYIQSFLYSEHKKIMETFLRDSEQDSLRVLDEYLRSMSAFRSAVVPPASSMPTVQDVMDYLYFLRHQTHIPTGFSFLDRQFDGGWGNTDYGILVARPRVGKSWTMVRMALSALEANKSVLYVTLEMTKDDTILRFLTEMSPDLPYYALNKGIANQEAARREAERLASMPLLIVEASDGCNTMGAIRAQIEAVRPRIVFVDQLSFLQDEQHAKERRLQFLNISGGIARATKELHVPIIVACQARREAEDRLPGPQDIAESDAPFQDADKVIALARDGDDGLRMAVLKSRTTAGHGEAALRPTGTVMWLWREADSMDQF